ncbi:DUF58 domain-containing protein [Microbacteriaceae bacterium VKM Ac-2855]|nr:DUF58 domain-containing protein [Microbacteriaceae bacterium VKM Ac-2855]
MRLLHRIRIRGVAPTARGWTMLLLGVVALLVAPAIAVRELLFVAFVLLGLPLGSCVSLVLSPIRLTVQRAFEPRVVAVGDVATVSVTLQNRGAALRSELAADDVLSRAETDGAVDEPVAEGRFVVPGLAASGGTGSRVLARYHLPARRRGVHRLGPLRLRRVDVLGLAERISDVGDAQPFVVTPRTVPLESDVLDAYGVGGSSPVAHPMAGAGADDVIPRDYRPGDAMRRVHWRASARTGELKVRQDEQNTDPHAWVLLETRSDRLGDDGDDLEWAVSMAASLAVHLIERGFETHLVETANTRTDPGRVSDEIEYAHDVLLHLARVRPLGSGYEIDAPARIADEVRDAGGGRPVIAILAHLTERDLTALGSVAVLARPAIAFVLGDRRAETSALSALGWYVVVVDEGTPVDDAWSMALAMRVLG